MNFVKSEVIKNLKRLRIALNNRGYDVHPVDQRCWDDQASLVGQNPEPVIFDVGANGGSVTAKYKEMFPQATIHCFEPQLEMIAELNRRFEHDKTVSINMTAIGKSEGTITLHVNASRDTSSVLEPDLEALSLSYRNILKPEATRDVAVITIDGFALSNSVERIDILKMDIQGGEMDALAGAARLLSRRAIGLIYSEVYFVPMYIGQPLFGDICEHLAQWGYRVHLIYNQVLNGRTGRPLWADCLFVSPDLRPASREILRGCLGGREALEKPT